MTGIDAYPLQWPAGWSRTKNPVSSRFGSHSIAKARDEVCKQIGMLQGRYITISSNLKIRNDGLPYSSQRCPDDCGIAVYFELSKKPVVFACDAWTDPSHNLWAIAKHIEAMRGQERWGVGSIEQAFTGYAALPPPKDKREWWEVFGVGKNSSIEEVMVKYRKLALLHHPDKGGNIDKWDELQSALNEAKLILT